MEVKPFWCDWWPCVRYLKGMFQSLPPYTRGHIESTICEDAAVAEVNHRDACTSQSISMINISYWQNSTENSTLLWLVNHPVWGVEQHWFRKVEGALFSLGFYWVEKKILCREDCENDLVEWTVIQKWEKKFSAMKDEAMKIFFRRGCRRRENGGYSLSL